MPKRKHLLTKLAKGYTIELMANQINTLITRPSHFKSKFILILVIVLISLIWTLDHFGIINLSRYFFPPVSRLPAKSQINQPTALDTCNVKKEGNPLVTSLAENNNIISGTFTGRITAVAQSGSRNSVIISLISEKGNQRYTFNILKQPGLFYDSNKARSVEAQSLAAGQKIMITFNCLPKGGNLFKFVQVNILPN